MAGRNENLLLRRYIEKAMVDLPALSSSVVGVLKALDKESVSMAEVEEIVLADPAVVTKLLRVVNSAYFGLPKPVSDISQVLLILGIQQIRNLVMAIGVLNALSATSPRIQALQREFWEHSFLSGAVAREVGKLRGIRGDDETTSFVCGLLQDVGKLFLITLFYMPYQEVLRKVEASGLELVVAEKQTLGVTHAELGAMLAERWNFPIQFTRVIGQHEGPFSTLTDLPVAIAHLSDRVASNVLGDEDSELFEGVDTLVQERLALSEKEQSLLLEYVAASIEESREMQSLLSA